MQVNQIVTFAWFQGSTNKPAQKDQQCKHLYIKTCAKKQKQNKNKSLRSFTVKKTQLFRTEHCRFPTRTSYCQILISAAKMHKVVYNQPKPLKTHYRKSNTHGLACGAQSVENNSITMKHEQTVEEKITAFVTRYQTQWKCSFVCLHFRLKVTYFLNGLTPL